MWHGTERQLLIKKYNKTILTKINVKKGDYELKAIVENIIDCII